MHGDNDLSLVPAKLVFSTAWAFTPGIPDGIDVAEVGMEKAGVNCSTGLAPWPSRLPMLMSTLCRAGQSGCYITPR